MKIRIGILFLILLASCKSPQARQPVSQQSGSYINESVARNKDLLAKEEERIQNIIDKDTSTEYLSSSNGFYYYYNKKSTDSTNTKTPEFGDVVVFDYSISTLEGKPIYAEGEKPTKGICRRQREAFQRTATRNKTDEGRRNCYVLFPFL